MGIKMSPSTVTMAMKLKVMAAALPARSNSGITVVMTAEVTNAIRYVVTGSNFLKKRATTAIEQTWMVAPKHAK